MATDIEKRNMELMQTLDDAWNAQDLDVFRARHNPNVIVRWPGKVEPTVGIEDHAQEAIDFLERFQISASTTDRTEFFSLLEIGPVRSLASGEQ